MSIDLRDDTSQVHLPSSSEGDDRFRVIFDAVNDGIFISDPATGRFTEINQPGCRMFGYPKDELIGCGVNTLSSGVPPHTQGTAVELNEKARLGEPQIFEWQCKTKSGVLFWTEISLRYAELNHTPAIVAIIRDIAERKRLDGELKLALQNTSATSNAKSAFLANMSHELRTPLNAIIGFSDLMLTQLLGPLGNPRYREYIDDIHSSGLHLLALINDVLDLSRLDANMVELVEQHISLPHVIEEARRMLDAQAKQSNIKLVIDLTADIPFIHGDERRIKQIVLNLIANAIKFTPGGGTVTVKAEHLASGLLLKVCDTGIGIAKTDLPKVFERFGQVDNRLSRKYKGTGLGLPLVKQLIELHGGSVTIESEVGAGTTVTVALPHGRVVKSTNIALASASHHS